MYFLLKLLALLPLRVLHFLGYLIAWVLIQTPSSIQRITRINIQLAYPELKPAAQEAMVRASIHSQCLSYLECIKFWGMSPEYSLSKIKNIQGAEHLENALNEKHGVIVIVPHLGSWELLNAWLCQQAQPMIMYKPNKNEQINRYILEARQKTSAVLVPANESGVRAIFKHLKQGGLTVILPDHLPKPSGGIYTDFFKQHVLSGTIVSKLAQKTGCRVVGLSCLRHHSQGSFDIHCTPVTAEISSKDLNLSVLSLNQHIEQTIAVAPLQYIWSYKRFRNCSHSLNLYKS
ncbi:lipid A biosynthesis acyltransferase [Acinetobacter sp. LoGeW2-3]|uniref:lysophospholipid acyltransferase family protein n=1 Tax=Acinetobacter sp. LoGeW2-3 TaxID=1808001 RepID=UPI000C05A1F8|nr:lysophospholipid acyltransferase family protein [Acinetobacter sp. LoGeW2-3]ATO19574.1 lipid A biosynthesis acyltransferase [Acinetobacter sp. LoGeW2-3]